MLSTCCDCAPGPGGCQREVATSEDSGGVGANSRWGHSGFVHPGRIDLRAFVRCASSFSVGGYLRLPMLAGGIFIRWFRFLLTAEQAPKKSHHPTSYLAAIVRLGRAGVNGLG